MKLNLKDFSNVCGEEYGLLVSRAVVDGMSPFRLKRVDLYMDYDIDYHEYRVLAAAILPNGCVIRYTKRIGAWDLDAYPDREFHRTADLMLESFRNRPTASLSKNIQLGEN